MEDTDRSVTVTVPGLTLLIVIGQLNFTGELSANYTDEKRKLRRT